MPNRPHYQAKLSDLMETLLSMQSHNVRLYDAMLKTGDPDREQQADFMDVLSRLMGVVEEEQRKAKDA